MARPVAVSPRKPRRHVRGRLLGRRLVRTAWRGGLRRRRRETPALLAALRRGEIMVRLDGGTYGLLPEEWLTRFGLIARDTVEEKILQLQSSKRDLAAAIISEDNSLIRDLEARIRSYSCRKCAITARGRSCGKETAPRRCRRTARSGQCKSPPARHRYFLVRCGSKCRPSGRRLRPPRARCRDRKSVV